jgi:hypothetical protein
MSESTNPIAEVNEPDSGWLVTPQQARTLKNRNDNQRFFCPDYDCKDKERYLSLKQSVKGKDFFSHRPGCEHPINPETLLHKSAVKWFERKAAFEIPAYRHDQTQLKQQTLKLDIEETRLEYSRLKTIIPDVLLCTESGFKFAVEIVVTSDVNESKAKKIEAFNLPTLRISLTSFYYRNKERCQTDLDFINEHLPKLLTDISLKSWVIAPDIDELPGDIETEPLPVAAPTPAPAINQSNPEDNSGCVPVLFLVVGILWLIDRLR